MKLSDLKDRMIIETRDGSLYIIIGDMALRNDEYLELKYYNDDLTYEDFKDLDIVAVYNKACVLNKIEDPGYPLWKRAPKLKNGMLVELKNGKRFIVIEGYLVGEECSVSIDNYSEDLTNKTSNDSDIDVIYSRLFCLKHMNESDLSNICIWRRY